MIIIPAGITLMAGFFFLGYYVGRYEGKSGVRSEGMPPLPEVVSKAMPKPEEFTFYKTLTEQGDKTVSIDLKPKAANTDNKIESKQSADAAKEVEKQPIKEKGRDSKVEKKPDQQDTVKQTASKAAQPAEKKIALAKQGTPSRLHYTVQVSSHQERQAAEDDVKRMKQNGFAAFVVSSVLPGKGTWFRVRIGSFSNKEAAEKLRKEVHAKIGVSPIIVLE